MGIKLDNFVQLQPHKTDALITMHTEEDNLDQAEQSEKLIFSQGKPVISNMSYRIKYENAYSEEQYCRSVELTSKNPLSHFMNIEYKRNQYLKA